MGVNQREETGLVLATVMDVALHYTINAESFIEGFKLKLLL